MPIDPFGLLGSAIANVVTDSLTAAMLALWNAGLWVLRAVLELEDAILTPSLGEDGPVGELYATTFWIALALVGILTLVQVGVALGKRTGTASAGSSSAPPSSGSCGSRGWGTASPWSPPAAA